MLIASTVAWIPDKSSQSAWVDSLASPKSNENEAEKRFGQGIAQNKWWGVEGRKVSIGLS